MMEISTFPEHVEYSLVKLNLHESIPKKYDKITKNSPNMVFDMYIISPKKDQFKPVFFSLFDFSKITRPRQTATHGPNFLQVSDCMERLFLVREHVGT